MKAIGVINNTLIDLVTNNTLFFSLEDFQEKIVRSSCCFLCGATPEDKIFNQEHIIPFWLLKKHNLFVRNITLPNNTIFKYGSYTIPCCIDCNSFLGENIEKPISRAFISGLEGFNDWVAKGNHTLLFVWMSLVFIKTHLKDLQLRMSRDLRLGDGKIGDVYYWESMHHIHCIARSLFTGAVIDPKVIGSLIVLPVVPEEEDFDYRDHFMAKTLMVNSGDICVMVTLNDSCAGINVLGQVLSKIKPPLNIFQYRELFARLIDANLMLKKRPVYFSRLENLQYKIMATIPEKIEISSNDENYGKILFWALEDLMNKNDPQFEYIKEQLLLGRMTYLFDENGAFKALG